jgi:hypothetical protein
VDVCIRVEKVNGGFSPSLNPAAFAIGMFSMPQHKVQLFRPLLLMQALYTALAAAGVWAVRWPTCAAWLPFMPTHNMIMHTAALAMTVVESAPSSPSRSVTLALIGYFFAAVATIGCQLQLSKIKPTITTPRKQA